MNPRSGAGEAALDPTKAHPYKVPELCRSPRRLLEQAGGDAGDRVTAAGLAAARGEPLVECEAVEEELAALELAAGDAFAVAPFLGAQGLDGDAEVGGGRLGVQVALCGRLLAQELRDALGERLEEVGREGDRDLRFHCTHRGRRVRRKLSPPPGALAKTCQTRASRTSRRHAVERKGLLCRQFAMGAAGIEPATPRV